MTRPQLTLIMVAGFVAGGLVGFLWGQSTRKGLSDNITTEVGDGKVVVTADLAGAARAGLVGMFR